MDGGHHAVGAFLREDILRREVGGGSRGGGDRGRKKHLPEVGGHCNVGLWVTQHLVAYDPFVTFLLGKECWAGDDPYVVPVTRQAPAHPLQPLPVVLVESLPHLRRDVREYECGVVPGQIVTILNCRKRWSLKMMSSKAWDGRPCLHMTFIPWSMEDCDTCAPAGRTD